MNLDDAITEIGRARRRLEDDQGRLARKNARAAVKAAVSTVLRAMDREYPLIRKERVVRVAMTPLAKKRRERAKRMDTVVVNAGTAAALAACGVRVVGPDGIGDWRVPLWAKRAMDAKIGPAEIRRAIHSPPVRKRIAALLRLRSATP